jgi:hypothetical protein
LLAAVPGVSVAPSAFEGSTPPTADTTHSELK